MSRRPPDDASDEPLPTPELGTVETVDSTIRPLPASDPAMAATVDGLAVPPEDFDPHRIGRFVILEEIGRGGMGTVFSAYDVELDRRVAIKQLQTRLHDTDQAVRIRREAHAMARLSHPNVAQVFDVGYHHGQLFIAMEYVDGPTLDVWLQAEPRSWAEIVGVFRQIGAGLAAAHEAGLVHRDFKPQNVLVGRSGRPRVIDFGLARSGGERVAAADREAFAGRSEDVLQSPLTQEGSLLGTPAYMAHEQLQGGEIGAATDQFAFCVALFEALFEVTPFSRRSIAERVAEIEIGELPPPPPDSRVPSRIRHALARGLAAEPAARWPSMSELLEELDVKFDVDPTAGWRGRLIVFGGLLVAVLGIMLVVTSQTGDAPNWAALVGADVAGVGVLGLVVYAFRRRLLASAYNRRMGVWLAGVLGGPLFVRIVNALHEIPMATSLGIEMAACGIVSLVGGALVARWIFVAAAIQMTVAVLGGLWPDDMVSLTRLGFVSTLFLAVVGTWYEQRRSHRRLGEGRDSLLGSLRSASRSGTSERGGKADDRR